MKTKQPSTISMGDIIAISADGFFVCTADDPKNSSPIGIARNAPDSNGYITVDLNPIGSITAEDINTSRITWDSPTVFPPFFCPKHGEIGEEIVSIVDADGKTHRYCKKCALEKLGAAEAFRWEDELTGHDFEEKET